jgi:hypothetical protein
MQASAISQTVTRSVQMLLQQTGWMVYHGPAYLQELPLKVRKVLLVPDCLLAHRQRHLPLCHLGGLRI